MVRIEIYPRGFANGTRYEVYWDDELNSTFRTWESAYRYVARRLNELADIAQTTFKGAGY